MMKNRLKEEIDTELEKLEMTEKLKEKIMESSKNKKIFYKKYMICVFAACFILILSVGALAKNSWFQKLERLLVGSYELEMLQMVEEKKSQVYDGIKMQVIAAMTDGDTTVAYIALQDLKQDRLQNSFELNEYNFLLNNKDFIGGWNYNVVNYDEKEKLLIVKMEMDGKELGGKNVSFQIDSFLSRKKETKDIPVFENIASLLQKKTKAKAINFGMFDENGNEKLTYFLKPNQLNLPVKNAEGVTLSSLGIADNQLILLFQCEANTSLQKEINCSFVKGTGQKEYFMNERLEYILDKNGNPKSIFREDLGKKGIYYCMITYDIDEIGLKQTKEPITLQMDFTNWESFFRGNWNLNFKVEKAKTIQKKCSLKFGDCEITTVSVSPIGLTLRGKSPNDNFLEENMEIGRAHV